MQPILERAKQLHQQGRLSEAAPLYRQVLAAVQGNPSVEYLLATLLYQQNQRGEALVLVANALSKNPDFVEARMLRGAIVQQENPQQALEDFKAATVQKPGHFEAWYNQGVTLTQLGRNWDAIGAFDRALQIRSDPAAWNNRGTALLAVGRAEDAVANFSRAVALNQSFAAAIYNRGTALLQLRRPKEALLDFDNFLKLAADSFEAWNNRGVALQALNLLDESLLSYRQSTAVRPDYAPAWKNVGMVLIALKRHSDALEAFSRAQSLSPSDPEVWRGHGDALFQLKRFSAAAGSFEKAAAITPNDAGLLARHATALRFSQQFDAALAGITKAAALAPDDPDVLSARGGLLCELNRISDGLGDYSRHAELIYAGVLPHGEEPDHKKRHDTEQRDWLAGQGVSLKDGEYHLTGGERLTSRAINPANGAAISRQWHEVQPQIVVIDDLLTPDALEGLRRFCRGSTVWKLPYPGGYLGAMQENGFSCPLLAQIAEEFQDTFPTIFNAHGLVRLWGFKYDSRLSGIGLHADQALVNVNFWITPDEANRNPDNGGLVIWDKSAPLDWDFERYNNFDEAEARHFLEQAGSKSVTVPHRANRAVIFDSDLFHETDAIEFEDGYLNRRINITMLFGRRTFDGT